jgi:ferredoxin/flavodoxin---NADP+ reductase
VREWRIAIIGAGPAGMYTADALTADSHSGVRVDIFDRLPTPFGLLRYGVAPDHLSMKRLTPVLQRILDRDGVRFAGGVEVGVDVTIEQLRARYDAVVYAAGAPADRPLELPGEHLPGVVGAGTFVSWYSGHPDAAVPEYLLHGEVAVVIGAGNVALDVARILLKSPEDLDHTDIPNGALDVLHRTNIREVYVLGRRGIADAKFTPNELREMGRIPGVDVVLRPEDLIIDESRLDAIAGDARITKNIEIFRGFSDAPGTSASKRLRFLFNVTPTEYRGTTHLQEIVVKPSGAREEDGALAETIIKAGIALRAIGFRGAGITGAPFDGGAGVVPSTLKGRVVRDGVVSHGEYVAGWMRRGSTGVLGTNRADGLLVAAAIREDLLDNSSAEPRFDAQQPDLADFLSGKRRWGAIDAAERELGERAGRVRTKIDSWTELDRITVAPQVERTAELTDAAL